LLRRAAASLLSRDLFCGKLRQSIGLQVINVLTDFVTLFLLMAYDLGSFCKKMKDG
jgi:hypothetical protein